MWQASHGPLPSPGPPARQSGRHERGPVGDVPPSSARPRRSPGRSTSSPSASDGARDCGQFQGEGAPAAQLGRVPGRAGHHHRRAPHARSPRPLRLPARARQAGFAGRIHCTPHTRARDDRAARRRAPPERDAEDAAVGGWSKHFAAASSMTPRTSRRPCRCSAPSTSTPTGVLGDGIVARWTRPGTSLGSASIRVQTPGGAVLFSGDVGRIDHPVLRAREVPGRRLRRRRVDPWRPRAPAATQPAARAARRRDPAHRAARRVGAHPSLRRRPHRGGAPGVGEMMRHERIPRLPVYVNSPMATAALDVYSVRRPSCVPTSTALGLDVGDLREVRTADESRASPRPARAGDHHQLLRDGDRRVLHHPSGCSPTRATRSSPPATRPLGTTRPPARRGRDADQDPRPVRRGAPESSWTTVLRPCRRQ